MPAYFCTCTEVPPGYYNIWVRDAEVGPEDYWRYFTNQNIADQYTLVLTLDIHEKEFEEYMATLQGEVYEKTFFPGAFRRIEDLSLAEQWLRDYPIWRQERERKRREHLLHIYQQKAKGVGEKKEV